MVGDGRASIPRRTGAGRVPTRVVEVDSGSERTRYAGRKRASQATFSPDGAWIAAVGQIEPSPPPFPENTARIWVFDASTGVERLVRDLYQASTLAWSADSRSVAVRSVAVSEDGRWVTGLATSATVGVYEIERGMPRYPPTPIWGGSQLLYSPTLRHIVVNARYGPAAPGWVPYSLAVIDARTGRNDADTGQSGVTQLAGARDGRWVVVGGEKGPNGYIETYDLGIEVSRYSVGASLTEIAMSSAGPPLVAVADTSAAVTIILAENGTRLVRRPIPGVIASIAFADSDQAVVAGGSSGVRLSAVAGDRYWKVDTIGAVNALAAVGATGEWIASAAGRSLHLLSSADGHARWSAPNTHPQAVTRIAANLDGTWIATGCADRRTRILSAATGTEVLSVEGDGKSEPLCSSRIGRCWRPATRTEPSF